MLRIFKKQTSIVGGKKRLKYNLTLKDDQILSKVIFFWGGCSQALHSKITLVGLGTIWDVKY